MTSELWCEDMDRYGRPDAVVAAFPGNQSLDDGLVPVNQGGTGLEPVRVEAGGLPPNHTWWVDAGGDGRLDLLWPGGSFLGLQLFLNR